MSTTTPLIRALVAQRRCELDAAEELDVTWPTQAQCRLLLKAKLATPDDPSDPLASVTLTEAGDASAEAAIDEHLFPDVLAGIRAADPIQLVTLGPDYEALGTYVHEIMSPTSWHAADVAHAVARLQADTLGDDDDDDGEEWDNGDDGDDGDDGDEEWDDSDDGDEEEDDGELGLPVGLVEGLTPDQVMLVDAADTIVQVVQSNAVEEPEVLLPLDRTHWQLWVAEA